MAFSPECPKCSQRAARIRRDFGCLGILTWPLSLIWLPRYWQCASCGHQWQA